MSAIDPLRTFVCSARKAAGVPAVEWVEIAPRGRLLTPFESEPMKWIRRRFGGADPSPAARPDLLTSTNPSPVGLPAPLVPDQSLVTQVAQFQSGGAEKALRALARSRGLRLKTLVLQDALELALQFYREQQLADPSADDGDGLAFYYGIINRNGATPFEVGFVRLFRARSGGDARGGSRLRLTLNYPWFETLEGSGLSSRLPGGVENTILCFSRKRLPDFERAVLSSAVFQELRAKAPRSANIRYELGWVMPPM